MKNVYYLLTAAFIFFQYACAPTFYIPNRQNIPVFKKKNDIRMNIAKGASGTEIQFGYAPTNQIGVILNTSNYNESPDEDGFKDGDGKGFEFGVGYYKQIDDFIFENYLLIGKGDFYNKAKFKSDLIPEDDGFIEADFTRISIQNSFTWSHKLIELYAGVRSSRLRYYNVIGNYHELGANLGNNLRDNPTFYLIEPAVGFKIGIKYAKLNIQYLRSFNLSGRELYHYVGNYSVGLQFSLTD